MSSALRQELASRAVILSQRVLDHMYENPFWMERYGERGRRFANEDSLHHINYLDQALAGGDAAVFTRYAQWLRTVLVSRGMCSEHLAENGTAILLLQEANRHFAGTKARHLRRPRKLRQSFIDLG